MFIKTSNGYLINESEIKTIYVRFSSNIDPLSAVVARTKDGNEICLYRDKELQLCQKYLEELYRKIGVEML